MGATTAPRATSASHSTAPRTSAPRATSPKTYNKRVVAKADENGGVRGGEGALKNTGEKDLPSLRDLIREDAEAAFRRDPSADSVSDITRFSVGFKIVRAYRRQHWLYEHGHRALALWLAMRSRIKYGADIHPAREIGCYNVTLNVWTCNPGAQRFYEAMGMTPLKTCLEQIL